MCALASETRTCIRPSWQRHRSSAVLIEPTLVACACVGRTSVLVACRRLSWEWSLHGTAAQGALMRDAAGDRKRGAGARGRGTVRIEQHRAERVLVPRLGRVVRRRIGAVATAADGATPRGGAIPVAVACKVARGMLRKSEARPVAAVGATGCEEKERKGGQANEAAKSHCTRSARRVPRRAFEKDRGHDTGV
jgi:hypothetical protein